MNASNETNGHSTCNDLIPIRYRLLSILSINALTLSILSININIDTINIIDSINNNIDKLAKAKFSEISELNPRSIDNRDKSHAS